MTRMSTSKTTSKLTKILPKSIVSQWQIWILYCAYVILGLAGYIFYPAQWDWGDNYDLIAKNMLEGKGFTESPNRIKSDISNNHIATFWEKHHIRFGVSNYDKPTALWEPGYPYWLLLWFFIFGFHSAWVVIVQILLMGVVLVVVYHVGKHLFGSRIGLIAGCILLFHPYMLRYTNQYPSENLFIPLFIGGFGAWYWVKKSPSLWKVIVFSVVWAAAGLTRMVGVYLALFSFVMLLLSTSKFRKYVLVSVGIFAVIWGAWAYRNSVEMGQWRVFPTKVGFHLWAGNNRIYLNQYLDKRAKIPEYTYLGAPENIPVLKEKYGLTDSEIKQLQRYDYPPELVDSSEVGRNKVLLQNYFLFVKEKPKFAIEYYLLNVVRSFSGNLDGFSHLGIRTIRSLYFLVLFILGLVGIIVAVKNFRKNWFMLLFTGFYALTLGTISVYRFRLPFDPIFALYAGMGMMWLYGLVFRAGSQTEIPERDSV
jgi:4-amino-4-deoxy-L-arabinose transferase-like glycosyltransferase